MNKIRKLKRAIGQDQILESLKNKKFFLLSENENRLLTIYLKDKKLIRYKKEFIYFFINRINVMTEEQQDYYFKHLQEIIPFDKGTLKIQKGIIDDIDYHMSVKTSKLKKKPSGYSKDAYFNEMIEKENYEELFNLYGLEQIQRDSNLFDSKGELK